MNHHYPDTTLKTMALLSDNVGIETQLRVFLGVNFWTCTKESGPPSIIYYQIRYKQYFFYYAGWPPKMLYILSKML